MHTTQRLVLALIFAAGFAGQGDLLKDAAALGRTHDDQLYESFNKSYSLSPSDTIDRAEIITWLHAKGVGCTVLTLGGDGVSVARNGEAETVVPAFDVDVVDTTGCGDAFTAGFVSGLLEGLDLIAAADRGLACGSLVATGLGSDAGIVDLAQVEEFRRTGRG